MLKLKYIFIVLLAFVALTAACGREATPEERTFRGQVRIVPAPGSQSLDRQYRTDIVIIELQDGEIMIPVGEQVTRLQSRAAGKNILFKGIIRENGRMYRGQRREVVNVTEIVSIED